MNGKDIEELIEKTYGQPYTLHESQIDRMMLQATMPPVFMIIQRPAFRWAGLTSFAACIAAGVFSGMNEASMNIQTADITAQGLEQIFTGLGGGLFL